MDKTILVNKNNLLSKDFIPEDLVEIREPMGTKIDKTYVNRLNREAYENFKVMQQAALQEGYEIFVDSSYRSYEYQEIIYQQLIQKKGFDYAIKYVALPGSSEHQTGLAMDIIFRRNGEMIEKQEETDPEIIWLFNNSYKYGYILRYPKNKEKITGFNYEPWHFRYVGKELATQLFMSGQTLEEYYSLKNEKNPRR